MPDSTPVSAELSRTVSSLARAFLAASRAWALYPANHPAARGAIERLARALSEDGPGGPIDLGVAPDALLLNGELLARGDGAIEELAALLHARDILRLTIQPDAPPASLEALLALLADDPVSVRERGGPAALWQAAGHAGVRLEQIDFTRVLDDRDRQPGERRRDEIWHAIVRGILGQHTSLGGGAQGRLLEIAGDAQAIGDLATDVMAPKCTPDGCPLLTSQAAAVLGAYRHLAAAVDVLAPERRDELLRNLASVTASLEPHLVMQILTTPDARANTGGPGLGQAVAETMDDAQVARLLAATLAIDGQATHRLASVFGTLAPDEARRRRVLTLARGLLGDSARGRAADVDALWKSTEELLLAYDERPFVSHDYRTGLDRIGARAEAMASDVPAELADLVATLEEENVRRLSATLLTDLLALDPHDGEATELARDLSVLCEDLLLAGDYETAHGVVHTLGAHAADKKRVSSPGARLALDRLVGTSTFHETAQFLGEMDEASAAAFARMCASIGPSATDATLPLFQTETATPAGARASAIVCGFGAGAVKHLAPLTTSPHWYVRRNAAELLGKIGSRDGVPLLQPLLRGPDARVTGAAIRALSGIDDPAAARSVHTALRAASGHQRAAVVDALVAERDPRVVPLLARILDESDAVGADHAVVLDALGAVGMLGGDAAIPAVDRVMRTRRWFARPRLRAVKAASVRALQRIGTPAAAAALSRAATDGDRLLKRAAADARGA